MPPGHSIALLLGLSLFDAAEFLREPGYSIAMDADSWVVRKPGLGGRQPVTISRHGDRRAAESHRRFLPPLRLGCLFVRFDPATQARTVIADWTAERDARDAETDVRGILNRFAPARLETLLQATPLYMARLYGATGHTAEEAGDPARFVIYVDPFRATGRLHAASTILHELMHVERCRARGFHANRASAVLPKEDFVLLGLADEFAVYRAEAELVRSFLDGRPEEEARAARDALRDPGLRWPLAVSVLLGPLGQEHRIREVRRQVVLDLAGVAAGYWDSRHADPLEPELRERISNWYKGSLEWKEIAAERPEWTEFR